MLCALISLQYKRNCLFPNLKAHRCLAFLPSHNTGQEAKDVVHHLLVCDVLSLDSGLHLLLLPQHLLQVFLLCQNGSLLFLFLLSRKVYLKEENPKCQNMSNKSRFTTDVYELQWDLREGGMQKHLMNENKLLFSCMVVSRECVLFALTMLHNIHCSVL